MLHKRANFAATLLYCELILCHQFVVPTEATRDQLSDVHSSEYLDWLCKSSSAIAQVPCSVLYLWTVSMTSHKVLLLACIMFRIYLCNLARQRGTSNYTASLQAGCPHSLWPPERDALGVSIISAYKVWLSAHRIMYPMAWYGTEWKIKQADSSRKSDKTVSHLFYLQSVSRLKDYQLAK